MSSNDEEECLKIIKIKNYYEILGVPKTADESQIKKAYRKLAIKFHPDKNKAKSAEEAFKKVNQAFTVLNDKQKRKNYDMFGTEEGVGSSHFSGDFDPMEVFNQFFGGSFGMNMGGGTRIRFSNGNGTFTMFSSSGFGGEPDDIFEQFFSFGPQQRRRRTDRERRAKNEEYIKQRQQKNQIISWIIQLFPLIFFFFFIFLPFFYIKTSI